MSISLVADGTSSQIGATTKLPTKIVLNLKIGLSVPRTPGSSPQAKVIKNIALDKVVRSGQVRNGLKSGAHFGFIFSDTFYR